MRYGVDPNVKGKENDSKADTMERSSKEFRKVRKATEMETGRKDQ